MVVNAVEVDNGQWGRNTIHIEHLQGIFANGADGHRYQAQLGFLSGAASQAAIQACWTQAGRGGANWKGTIQVRLDQSWVLCTGEKNTCWDNREEGGGSLRYQIYFRDYVWQSLLNDYIAGGMAATALNQYYYDVQAAVFDPICGSVPDTASMGFIFTRVD